MESVQRILDVNVPVAAAYEQWTRFEDFPRFMDGVEEVRRIDDTHLHWRASIAGRPHEGFRLGLPKAGRWRELLNSDAAEFGGSGVGNLGGVEATDDPWAGRPASGVFTLPPLAAVWFTLDE